MEAEDERECDDESLVREAEARSGTDSPDCACNG